LANVRNFDFEIEITIGANVRNPSTLHFLGALGEVIAR
jgi:hypothetical protein